MKDNEVIEELRVLCVGMVCLLMKGIDEYCELIVVFVNQKCGKLTVYEERITVMLIFHQLNHL
jgi:hypothetical protein